MIKSMTGYCKKKVSHDNIACDIEIKSVNHRFLDIKVFLPKQFDYLTETIKRQVKNKIGRGKVDIYIRLAPETDVTESLAINAPVMENLKSTIKILQSNLNKSIELNLSGLINIKNLLIYKESELKEEVYKNLLFAATSQGLEELIKMRRREGELLRKDIGQQIKLMEKIMTNISSCKEKTFEHYVLKLKKNLKSLSLKYNENDPRIIQELGFFIDRSDITEEITRFNTHLTQMQEMLDSDAPVGRKMDFLLQELNRETNTICSKASYIKVIQNGVELKSEIEKIREQVQNIE